jgi:DNA invertase Pin-like site-specific DNA recombinase
VNNKKETDYTKLKYVLYARKSSADNESQVHSVPDQVKDCERLVKQKGLKGLSPDDIRTESKSAKTPGMRPEFDRMIDDIKSGRYDAIVCRHPDRLCRNMLEGGMIIDLLDQGKLKDIRFYSHDFSNDANGKMLLGMLFVFSKQYSDDLSAKITSSVENRWDEGKSGGQPKWGYDRNNQTGLYEPNEFFDIVKEAWTRRIKGDSYKVIVEFLMEKGYYRKTKLVRGKRVRQRNKILPSPNAVAKMLRDPFYYGVLLQTGQTVDLRAIVDDFKPMISEDQFNEVQTIAVGRTRDVHKKKRHEFKPLHRMVYCDECYGKTSDSNGNPMWMSVGKNKPGGSDHSVLSYECKNRECSRKPKSVRAYHIFNAIYDRLDKIEIKPEAFDEYQKRAESYTESKIISIKEDIASKSGARSHKKRELSQLSLGLARLTEDSPAYASVNSEVESLAAYIQDLDDDISELEAKIKNSSEIELNRTAFLNLIKSAADKMRAANVVEKDRLCRIMFSNLRIDDEMRVFFTWNEPFDVLIKLLKCDSGARERTRTSTPCGIGPSDQHVYHSITRALYTLYRFESGLAHILRVPKNIYDNKWSRVYSFPKCHWHFSPPRLAALVPQTIVSTIPSLAHYTPYIILF